MRSTAEKEFSLSAPTAVNESTRPAHNLIQPRAWLAARLGESRIAKEQTSEQSTQVSPKLAVSLRDTRLHNAQRETPWFHHGLWHKHVQMSIIHFGPVDPLFDDYGAEIWQF